uniref:Uncharacterized protein n=1 Tax=Helianthus annuus TaxID=4232 RepID=A0A251TYJ0_HELAN
MPFLTVLILKLWNMQEESKCGCQDIQGGAGSRIRIVATLTIPGLVGTKGGPIGGAGSRIHDHRRYTIISFISFDIFM